MAKKKTFKHNVFGELHVLVEDDGTVLFLVQDIVIILDVSFECMLTASCFIVGGIYEYSFKTEEWQRQDALLLDGAIITDTDGCVSVPKEEDESNLSLKSQNLSFIKLKIQELL